MSLLEDAKNFKKTIAAAKNGKSSKNGTAKPYFKFQNRLKHDESHWWHIENASKSLKPTIVYTKLIDWLNTRGYFKFKINEFDAIIVIVQDNVVFEQNYTQVWDHIFNYIENLPEGIECIANPDNEDARTVVELHRDKLREMTMRSINNYINKDSGWHFFPVFEANWVQDTKQTCYKFYQNCFVEITKQGIKTKAYSDLPGHIWDSQKINRRFELLEPEQIIEIFGGYKTDVYDRPVNAKFFFPDFFKKIASNDPDFFEALQTIVGYLLHDFFESKPKAIMLTDRISFGGPSGRTGKGLLLTAISKMTEMARINGKDFKESDNFKYQLLKHTSKVVALDDISRKFNFEERFNDISEGIQVNQKGLKAFRILAKMIITTNKTLEGESSSHKDRRTDFALSNFFSDPENFPFLDGKTYGVGEFYGEWFFADWSATKWQYFDNFMLSCIARYMEVGKPIQVEDPFLKRRKLYDRTHEDFVEFMDDKFKNKEFEVDVKYDRTIILNEFKNIYEDHSSLTQNKFGKWKKAYCEFVEIEYELFKSGSIRWIKFTKLTTTD